jgi:hypothetical protein
MLLSPRRRSTAADLLRVLAIWLAVILLWQGLAAAHALGAGPLHHHRGSTNPNRITALAHGHQHGDARHHHAADDASVVPVDAAQDAFDAAAFALTAAMALLAMGLARTMADSSVHGWVAMPPPAWRNAVAAASRRPPRGG